MIDLYDTQAVANAIDDLLNGPSCKPEDRRVHFVLCVNVCGTPIVGFCASDPNEVSLAIVREVAHRLQQDTHLN